MARPDATAKLKATQHKEGPSRILIGGIVAALAIIALVVGAILVDQSGKSGDAPPAAAGNLAISGQTADGAPTIEIFEDPQCSACIQLENSIGHALMERAQTGDYNVYVRPMIFQEAKMGNNDSSEAVNAFYCAKDAGKFPDYHAAFFADQAAGKFTGQESWSPQDHVNLAARVGIQGDALEKFTTCINDSTYADDVKKGQDWANTKIRKGTPEIYVNGEYVEHGDLFKMDEAGQVDAQGTVDALFAKADEISGRDSAPATGTTETEGTETEGTTTEGTETGTTESPAAPETEAPSAPATTS